MIHKNVIKSVLGPRNTTSAMNALASSVYASANNRTIANSYKAAYDKAYTYAIGIGLGVTNANAFAKDNAMNAKAFAKAVKNGVANPKEGRPQEGGKHKKHTRKHKQVRKRKHTRKH